MKFDALDHTLFDGGRAPNPRRVAMYLAERGIAVSIEPVDMGALGHKSQSIAALNPLMQLPLLKLPDGSVLTESIAICRYFDALYPGSAMFGQNARGAGGARGAQGAAFAEMWQRRVEFGWLYPVAQAFRHGHPAMKEWEVPQIAPWGEANRPKAQKFAQLLNDHLAENSFICGDDFTIADITGIIAMDFSKVARIAYADELTHLFRWSADIRERPSYRP